MLAPRKNRKEKKNKTLTINNSYNSVNARYTRSIKKVSKKRKRGLKDAFSWLKENGTGSFVRAWKLICLTVFSVLTLGVISVVVVGGYLYFSNSDYFSIRNVSIIGLNKVQREEIVSLTSLDRAGNVLTFDTNEAKDSLLTLPWIDEVKIERVMPDTINITVKEYEAKAVVNIGELYLMDATGHPFKKMENGDNPQLPIISGFSEDELLAKRPHTQEAVVEIYKLVEILSERNDDFKIDNISELHYDTTRGFTIYTKNNKVKIKVGFNYYNEKFNRLGQVLSHLKEINQYEGISYLNIETAPRVTVRYHNGNPNLENKKV